MSSFLRSRRNCIIIVILAFLTTLFLFQVGLSQILNKSKPKIVNYLSNNFGYRFALETVSFSFFKGLSLNGIRVFYNNRDKPPIFIKDAFITIRILPIFLGKLAVNIKLNELSLIMNKEEQGYNLQIMFSDIYKKISESKALMPIIVTNRVNIFIGVAKLIYTSNASFKNNMYILFKNARIEQKSDKFKFNSNIQFNYHLLEDAYLSRFFKNKHILQEMKCDIQGTIIGKNLNMNLIVLDIGKEQILGMGINKEFAERNPYVDFIFIPSTISLNNIAFIKENFNSNGSAFLSLKFTGPLDNIKKTITGVLDECYFSYTLPSQEVLGIKNLSGKLEYKNGLLLLDNIYLKLNNLPLNLKLQTSISYEPDILLNISLPKEFLSSQNLPLNRLEAIFNGKIKRTLVGNLEISALYIRKGLNLDMQAYFKNIDFDYSNLKEKYFRANSVGLKKVTAYKIQKLNFINLKSKVNLSKDRIEVKDLNCIGYNGILNGGIKLDIAEKASLIFKFNGLGLDVKTLMQDINISNKLFTGSMKIKIAFNNLSKEFLKGGCLIKNGTADLGILADVVQLPPLKNKNFDVIHTYFSVSKNMIRVRSIKLYSPDIMLSAYWDTNSKIDGILNLKIASGLLNQSISFKKLLRLTKIKKPYLDFSFLLGGIPKTVRIMWLKDEFKNKLKQDLPAWARRSIEDNLDKMIDDLSSKPR